MRRRPVADGAAMHSPHPIAAWPVPMPSGQSLRLGS